MVNKIEAPGKVVIEVRGGVAYVASAPANIEVIIYDYDDQSSEEAYNASSSGWDAHTINMKE